MLFLSFLYIVNQQSIVSISNDNNDNRTHPTQVPFGMEIRKTYTELCMNPNTAQFCHNVYHYFLGGNPQNLNMVSFDDFGHFFQCFVLFSSIE